MPSRTLLRSFLALWITTALVLVVLSAQTVRAAWRAFGPAHPHLRLLGSVEALGAVHGPLTRTQWRAATAGLPAPRSSA